MMMAMTIATGSMRPIRPGALPLGPDAQARGSPPPVPAVAVRRARLESLLGLHPDRHVVLVRGPVGAGKTTLVAQWVRSQAAPCAWLALDPSHNDPGLLLRQLGDVLERLRPATAPGSTRPEPGPGPGGHTALGDLVDVVATQLGSDIVLVVDGVDHLQDRAAQQILGLLVENPAEALRLVLISRSKPMCGVERARLRDDLVEIPPAVLRFHRSEIEALLAELDEGRLGAGELEQETLGWAAGLRLAHLDSQEADGPAPELGGPDDATLGYIREELMDGAPEEVRAFLEVTCWLPVLTDPLCTAVASQNGHGPGSTGIVSQTLPILPIASRPGAFRYPPILTRALQHEYHRRDAGAALRARHRAARACRHAGELVTSVDVFLQAGRAKAAANVCAQLAEGGDSSLRSVAELLAVVPPTVRGDGRLLPWRIRSAVAAGRPDEARHLLEHADRVRALGPQSGIAEHRDLMVARAAVAEYAGDVATLLACAGRVAAAPTRRRSDHEVDRRAEGWRIRALAWSGDLDGARAAAGPHHAAGPDASAEIAGEIALAGAWVSWLDGDVAALSGLTARRRHDVLDSPARPAESALLTGAAHREANDMAEATRELTEALRLATTTCHRIVAAVAAGELARCRHAAGATMEALELVVSARSRAGALPPAIDALLRATEGRIRLQHGDGPGAEALLRDAPPGAEMQILATRIALHQAPGHARSLLEAVEARTPRQSVETMLLHALLPDTDEADVSAMLVDAIAAGAPLGLVRTFLDEGPALTRRLQQLALASPERVLGRFAALAAQELALVPSGDAAEPIEQLTTRELAVLRMLPLRMSNREMAAQLYVSVNTLKTHIRAIYRKLDVPHRSAAVRRAKALQLV